MDGAADVAETSYTPFQSKPDAAPNAAQIVRRVKPTPGSQLALFAERYSYHGLRSLDREGETLELEADHRLPRRDRERHPMTSSYGVGLNHLPSGRFPANGAMAGGAGDRPQPGYRWTARIGLGEQIVTTKTLATHASFPWPEGSPARRRRLDLASVPQRWHLGSPVQWRRSS